MSRPDVLGIPAARTDPRHHRLEPAADTREEATDRSGPIAKKSPPSRRSRQPAFQRMQALGVGLAITESQRAGYAFASRVSFRSPNFSCSQSCFAYFSHKYRII